MKRIYVAGLISRNADGSEAKTLDFLRNIRLGQFAALKVIWAGFAAFCPFQDYQYALLDDQQLSGEAYYDVSMAWLEVSDAVLVISGEGLGGGVDREIARAHELNIPIYRSIRDLIADNDRS